MPGSAVVVVVVLVVVVVESPVPPRRTIAQTIVWVMSQSFVSSQRIWAPLSPVPR
jgi:hypothetical protein